MGVEALKCNGCEKIIDDHGGYPQCVYCRKRYHDKNCGGGWTSKSNELICVDCLAKCALCRRPLNILILCETCESEYCISCFYKYFDTGLRGTTQIPTALQVKDTKAEETTMPVKECLWCNTMKKEDMPEWTSASNRPPLACTLCWEGRDCCVDSVKKDCACGLSNLCTAHADKHACKFRIIQQKRKLFIEVNEDLVKDYIFKKMKADGDIISFCAEMEGFPKYCPSE
jgi:hypothetical protein